MVFCCVVGATSLFSDIYSFEDTTQKAPKIISIDMNSLVAQSIFSATLG